MSLISKIEADRLAFLKAGKSAERSILTTLVGEVNAKAKNECRAVTDDDVIKTIKKFIDGLDETDGLVGVTEATALERKLLTPYMPIMMSVDEVKYILSVGGISTVKDAQIFMKANYAGKYNPADVNKALK
jgi:uncharacterized protein YqeY